MRNLITLTLAVALAALGAVRTDGQQPQGQPQKDQQQNNQPSGPGQQQTTGSASATATTKAEIPKITGNWAVASGEREGQKIPEDRLQGARAEITADTITVTGRDGKTMFALRYEWNTSRVPHEINMRMIEGPNKGQVAQGIFEMDSFKRMKLCYSPGIQGRPREFRTLTGGHVEYLFILTRGDGAVAQGGAVETGTEQVQPGVGVVAGGAILGGTGNVGTTWRVLAGETEGGPIAPERLRDARLTVIGRTLVLTTRGGQQKMTASFSVDASQTPHQLNMTALDGPMKGQNAAGIIEQSGDRVRICYFVNVPQRPREFRTQLGGPKDFLFVLQRDDTVSPAQPGQGQRDPQQKDQDQSKQDPPKQGAKAKGPPR